MLTKEQIYKLSQIDGWKKFCESNKDKVLQKAHEVFMKAKQEGKLPKKNSQNYIWIQNKKKVKQGKYNWYAELDDIAESYGFPNVFEILDIKNQTFNKFKYILIRTKQRGTLPKQHSSDKQEAKDAAWIHNKKHKQSFWHSDLVELAIKSGFPEMFSLSSEKEKTIIKSHEVFARAKAIKKLPSDKRNGNIESLDSKWIQRFRQARKGKGTSNWYPELEDIAKQYGFPNTFDIC